MIFEIVNPSDKYTIEAEKWDVACAAGLIIGRGQMALEEIGGDHELPLFIFGGLEEWIEAEFDATLEEFMKTPDKLEIAACLNSVIIGNRDAYLLGLGDKTDEEAKDFWNEWQDLHRSSMNDIGSYARNYAAKLIEQFGDKDAAN